MEEQQQDMFKKKVKIFSSSWCTQCKPVKVALGELEEEGLVEVEYLDIDSASGQEGVTEHSVRGIPTMVNESGGLMVGAKTKNQIKEWLEV